VIGHDRRRIGSGSCRRRGLGGHIAIVKTRPEPAERAVPGADRRKTEMTKFLTVLLSGAAMAACCTLAFSSQANAQGSGDQSNSVRVSYADLDINHANGMAVLKSRIEAAAVEACGGETDVRDLGRRALVTRCRTEAVDQAMTQLDSGKVAYADRTNVGR
jgi:UrcA family protein